MKISIRDLLWLLAVLALGLGWWVNNRALWLSRREIDEERIEVIRLAKELRDNLEIAKREIELRDRIRQAQMRGETIKILSEENIVDWSVLEEQIPPRNGYRAARETPPASSVHAPSTPKE